MVPLKGSIQIAICVWVKKELAACPSSSVRLVVVVDGLSIEKFSGIVSAVTGFLEPDWQIFVVESLRDELGISPWSSMSMNQLHHSNLFCLEKQTTFVKNFGLP